MSHKGEKCIPDKSKFVHDCDGSEPLFCVFVKFNAEIEIRSCMLGCLHMSARIGTAFVGMCAFQHAEAELAFEGWRWRNEKPICSSGD